MKKNANFTKILNKSHEKKWVALSPNRSKVLGSSTNLAELTTKVNNKDAVYMKVLAGDTAFHF